MRNREKSGLTKEQAVKLAKKARELNYAKVVKERKNKKTAK